MVAWKCIELYPRLWAVVVCAGVHTTPQIEYDLSLHQQRLRGRKHLSSNPLYEIISTR
jgi:hypothetical protein